MNSKPYGISHLLHLIPTTAVPRRHNSAAIMSSSEEAQLSSDSLNAAPRLQIYPQKNSGVSPFWREKYEREARRYWDMFYKRHQDKFFKDRHYLDKEWGHYFDGSWQKHVLEVGCGAGNTIYPLIATYPNVFVHACDFSSRAVDLVKTHKDFTENRIDAFVCDLTADDLSQFVPPASVDIVTMIFVLSAVSPEKMPLVLSNIRKVIKPNGRVLLRDYATGDLAQERFTGKDQMISENFYVRGDGTRAFYFSNEFLTNLFQENDFEVEEIGVCCKQVENRSRELLMNRRWVQAVFRASVNVESVSSPSVVEPHCDEIIDHKTQDNRNKLGNDPALMENSEVDISDGIGLDMFGVSSSMDNTVLPVNVSGSHFVIRVLSKEYQHTCKSTGLMLWESARLMASILVRNPAIVSGKRVLELGCGCSGICSMVAAQSANVVVATDGDTKALDLLMLNVSSNLASPLLDKFVVKRLEWGNNSHIEAVKRVSPEDGFDVIIGTDVTYIPEAISPLFSTARQLISAQGHSGKDSQDPGLILCHILRRVDEESILSAASQCGFVLVERWPSESSPPGIISSWFAGNGDEDVVSSALSIMYFRSGH
ncbi:hypothetical protein MLD38_015405 [Melastoma candidum]|uniref:Uncharacterized protein n=1 Tax=Melastoma candidum TaxID=119954 RepID=A0ACB9RFV3_9MYRT|nr:hypothetical protein MLD38_015405 [Melastoma candidum]